MADLRELRRGADQSSVIRRLPAGVQFSRLRSISGPITPAEEKEERTRRAERNSQEVLIRRINASVGEVAGGRAPEIPRHRYTHPRENRRESGSFRNGCRAPIQARPRPRPTLNLNPPDRATPFPPRLKITAAVRITVSSQSSRRDAHPARDGYRYGAERREDESRGLLRFFGSEKISPLRPGHSNGAADRFHPVTMHRCFPVDREIRPRDLDPGEPVDQSFVLRSTPLTPSFVRLSLHSACS